MSFGLIAAFSLPVFFRNIDRFVKDKEDDIVMGLAFKGEEFVNNARVNGEYQDRTSNLRGSIAYDVVRNGVTAQSDYSGGGKGDSESRYFAEKAVDDVIFENSLLSDDKIWLIGVAGMEYAAAVESKGFDVITSSVPSDNSIRSLLKGAGLV